MWKIKTSLERALRLLCRLDDRWYRRFVPVLVVGWGLAGGYAAAQEGGSQETQKAAQKLAAVTAARAVLQDLETLDLSELEKEWFVNILGNPTAHRSESKSRETFSQEYMKELEQRLDDLLARIHVSFNPEQEPGRWFTREWLVEHMTNRFGDDIKESLDANRKEHFTPLFGRARTAAVRGQLAELTLSLRPSLEEVDQVNEAGWNTAARQNLRRVLVGRMGKDVTLLEETARELQRLAEEIVDDAREQYRSQEAALERPVPERARTAEAIDRVLASHVSATLQALRLAQSDESVYREFPSIEQRRRQKAESIVKKRFAAFVRDYRLADLEPRVRQLLEANTSRHREIVKSREICVDSFLPQTKQKVVTAYAEGADEVFHTHLEGLLSGDPDVRKTLRSRLESAIEPILARVRGDLAKRQLNGYFPTVSSDRWQVPENTLLEMHQRELAMERFEDFAALPFINRGGQPYERQRLFEETEQLALSEVSKLLSEGERAWASQLRMVSSFEDKVESEIRENPRERTPDEWQVYFVKELETRWQEERLNLVWRGHTEPPPHIANKYLDVFGHAEKELQDLVRRQYELAEKAAEEKQVLVQKAEEPQVPATPNEQGDAISEPETNGADSPTQNPGPGVPGGPSQVDGLSKGMGIPGSGGRGGAAAGCLMPILQFLLFLLLTYVVIRLLVWLYRRLPPSLSAASPAVLLSILLGVLLVALVFVMVRTSGVRIQVDAGQLEGIQEELTQIIGVQPDIRERKLVYDLGPFDRIIVEERAPGKD